MERLLLTAVLLAVAAAAAWLVRRHLRPAPPTQARWRVPTQLDRADFDAATPWLLAVFTSATCDSCAGAKEKAAVLASPDVAVVEVAWQDQRHLHDRYSIDVVPTIVLADGDGVVLASFVGAPTATDLWAAVAEVRSPGSTPFDPNRPG